MSDESLEHVPVLLKEVMDLVITDKNGIYFDGTLGDGGYTRKLWDTIGTKGKVISVDWDEKSILQVDNWLVPAYSENRRFIHRANFCEIGDILKNHRIEAVHGIVLDIGLSSRQLNDPDRGFSYRYDSPLDMRMDNRLPDSVFELLSKRTENDLRSIFFKYGEEKRSARLANIIVRERINKPIRSTSDLVTLMKKHWRPRFFTKSASRIFQALRIAVNRELDNLERFLDICWDFMLPGGRIAVISYHSLEDRIVKNTFRNHENPCICHNDAPVCQCGNIPDAKIITRKPVRPDAEEVAANPRSRSAKLRVAEKI